MTIKPVLIIAGILCTFFLHSKEGWTETVKEGFYDYLCELHPAIMCGVVIVEDPGPVP